MSFSYQMLFVLSLLGFFVACDSNKSSKKSNIRAAGQGGSKSGDASLGGQSSENEQGVTNPAVDKFLGLVSQIGQRANELNREKDRRGKLRLALAANNGTGCAYDVKVSSLEIFIDGAALDDSDVSKALGQADNLPTEPSPTYKFYFGIGTKGSKALTFTHDESKEAMFLPGGRKLITPEINLKIGDIQQIRILKEKPTFVVNDFCEGKCSDDKIVKETLRSQINSLKIKVNRHLVYYNPNIQHVFAKEVDSSDARSGYTTGLAWSDEGVQLNQKFLDLMQQDDCSGL